VACGNPWLEEQVRPLNPRTALLPTVVEVKADTPRKRHEPGQSFTAVWIGSASTLPYLEALLPHLEPLADEIPGFRVRVISDCFPDCAKPTLEKVHWSRPAEKEHLLAADAGLMPLKDDDWCRGKCGLKLLQYGALGLPSVCSPVGVNPSIVKHEVSGFHADTPDTWRDALRRLAQDPSLRNRMGAAARTHVKKHYSVNAHLDRFVKILHETAARRQ
jgi:glycosyltransferase involved in cell wall biosynthesis